MAERWRCARLNPTAPVPDVTIRCDVVPECQKHIAPTADLPALCVFTPAEEPRPRLTMPIVGKRTRWTDFSERTMRVALAMRGGVSLAVWIGGAVAEFDFARSIRAYRVTDPDADPPVRDKELTPNQVRGVLFWPEAEPPKPDSPAIVRAQRYVLALGRAGFHRLDPDVLAGASAGGLNAVLFAAAQREGRSAGDALTLWQKHGSIEKLIRPPGVGSVTSVLNGTYFFEHIRGALRAYTAMTHPDLRQPFVTVDLSATILDAQDAGQQSLRDGRGGFHFRGEDGRVLYRLSGSGEGWARTTEPGGEYIPGLAEPADVRIRARRRLALAARATSSFPGAFESVQIRSHTPVDVSTPSGSTDPDDETTPDAAESADYGKEIDESASFVAHRVEGELWGQDVFRVVDGGVLDNIPIERAIRAIGPRAALHPTQRELVYLDPSPPEQPLAPPRDRARDGSFLAVIRASRGRQKPNESASRDVAAIFDRVADLYAAEGRLSALAALGDTDWTQAGLELRRRAYVRDRAPRDADLVASVLDDPAGWQTGSRLAVRRAWAVPDAQSRWFSRWRVWLSRGFAGRADGVAMEPVDEVCMDARAVTDAAASVIAAVRFVETTVLKAVDGGALEERIDRAALTDARKMAYAAHAVGIAAGDRRIFRLLEAAEAHCQTPREPLGVPVTEKDAATGWLRSGTSVCIEGDAEPWKELSTAWVKVRAQLDVVGEMASITEDPDSAGGTTPGQGLVRRVDPPGGESAAGETVAQRWKERPWQYAVHSEHVMDLAPYLVPAGIPALEGYPLFTRIDADDVLPQGAADDPNSPFRALRAWQRERVVADALAEAVPSMDASGVHGRQLRAQTVLSRLGSPVLPASMKLGGTQIANFSGFLSTAWRTNDWWWGRRDAARGIEAMLRVPAAALDEGILSETPARLDAGAGGLARLKGTYRYAVAARLARVAERAVRGTSIWMKILTQMIFVLLRPLLLLVPLVIDPPRLVAVAAVFVTTTTLTSVGTDGDAFRWGIFWLVTAVLLLVCAATMAVIGADIAARWSALRRAAYENPEAVGRIRIDQYRWPRRRIALIVVFMGAAAAFAGFAAASGMVATFVVWAGVAGALCALAIFRMRSVRSHLLAPERRYVLEATVVAAVVAAVIVVAGFDIRVEAQWLWGAAFLVVGWLICARWLSLWWALVIPIVAVALPAIGVVLLPSVPPGILWWLGITLWANVLWVVPQVFTLHPSASATDELRDLLKE